MENQRPLRLVTSPENDPEKPNLIWAKGLEQEQIRLVADPGTIRRLEDGRLNAKIGEYCGLIHGAVPDGTNGLFSASTMFQGLRRPCIRLGRDSEICVYVLNPKDTYVYRRTAKSTGAGPERHPKPVDSVFVVYADLAKTETTLGGTVVAVDGTILFWEWVLADSGDPRLPADYRNRYGRQVW